MAKHIRVIVDNKRGKKTKSNTLSKDLTRFTKDHVGGRPNDRK